MVLITADFDGFDQDEVMFETQNENDATLLDNYAQEHGYDLLEYPEGHVEMIVPAVVADLVSFDLEKLGLTIEVQPLI